MIEMINHIKTMATKFPFLAKNKKGYQNLIKLSSIGYIEGFYYVPRIDKEIILKYSNDLIVTTGGLQW